MGIDIKIITCKIYYAKTVVHLAIIASLVGTKLLIFTPILHVETVKLNNVIPSGL